MLSAVAGGTMIALSMLTPGAQAPGGDISGSPRRELAIAADRAIICLVYATGRAILYGKTMASDVTCDDATGTDVDPSHGPRQAALGAAGCPGSGE
jgi:hypothetical protein